MTIYLDIIFLENFILNLIILYAVGIETKTQMKHIKIILASIIGSFYAIVTYIIKNGFINSIIMKFILSIIMIYISFETKNYKELLKKTVFFYFTSFAFGGGALAVIYMVNAKKISIENGIILGKYTLFTIAIGVTLAFIVTIISFKLIKNKISKKDLIRNITIKINNKYIKVKAMIDTGNLLKEPITNVPVIVVEDKLFKNTIDEEILDNIENILGGDLSNISETIKNKYISKMRVIPFTSIGKQHGMLLGIKAQEVIIEENNETRKLNKVIIGLYNRKLNKKNEYQALIGLI